MITVYRFAKAKYAKDPLSGKGGLEVGGRWHRKGGRIVYCAGSLSLSALEFFVHLPMVQSKLQRVSLEADIPDAVRIEMLDPGKLPARWYGVPPITETADLGAEWLEQQRSAVLRVPSAISRGEYNYLINPLHSESASITARAALPYSYDARMWK